VACKDGAHRTSKLTLAAVPTAVSCSRAFVRCVLGQWRLGHLTETAQLLTSELVTNAVKATGTMDPSLGAVLFGEAHLIQVRLHLVSGGLVIGVWDRDPRPPVRKEPDRDAENGRGLLLVEGLSKRWGCHKLSGTSGKVVWCELDTAPPTTGSGLPVRTPGAVPGQGVEVADDMALLERVLEGLRRL
jgi:anti-sigma regulatory factor (Ser/Thr protein kinase)